MGYYDITVLYRYTCDCRYYEETTIKKQADAVCPLCKNELTEMIVNVFNYPKHWDRNWVFQQIIIPMYKDNYDWNVIEQEIAIQKQSQGWNNDGTYHISEPARALVRLHYRHSKEMVL